MPSRVSFMHAHIQDRQMIRPPRMDVKNDKENYKQKWDIVSDAIEIILKGGERDLSFEKLYLIAYELVLSGNGSKLYESINEKLKHYVDAVCKVKVEEAGESDLLGSIARVYEHYKRASTLVSDVFLYLNLNLSKVEKNTIYQVAIKTFHDIVYICFREKVVHDMLKLIKIERQGGEISKKLIANCTMMLHDMNCYVEEFQQPLLETSRTYFEDLANAWVAELSVPQYLEKVCNSIHEELERANVYLKPITSPLLEEIMRDTMVVKHMNFILENNNQGFINLLANDNLEDLGRMYFLMEDSKERINDLATRLEEYIFETGKDYVLNTQNLQDPVSFIQDLLAMKDKYDIILSQSFKNDKRMIEAVQSGFSKFADGNLQKRLAEYLSLYLDYAMRNNTQKENFGASLDNALAIFAHLQDKDVFENYYKIHLSKRLLFSRSHSISSINESETLVIQKLKETCGYSFVSKLEGMFNDMRLSKKCHEKFLEHSEYINVVKPLNIDLFVNVLTSCFWPSYTVCNAILPAPMMACTKAFRNYYKDTHTHRVLTWKKNLGDGVMIARFPLSKHELIVTTYQMIILMVFNDLNEITFADLSQMTGIPDKDLERNLMLLFLGKHKLISKEPKSKSIKATDILKWNANFKSKDITIKMSGKLVKEQKESEDKEDNEDKDEIDEKDEKDETEDKDKNMNNEDSNNSCMNYILKYIKEQKKVAYKDVFAHVSKSMGDNVITAFDFKREVERLIQFNKIERSEEDRRILRYVGADNND